MKKTIKTKMIVMGIFAFVCIFVGALFIILPTLNKNNEEKPLNPNFNNLQTFDVSYSSKLGQQNQTLGYVERNIPSEIKNEGIFTDVIKFGTNTTLNEEQRAKLFEENEAILNFDSLDKDGNLIRNGELTGKKLYKHSASVGLYYGNVADEEKAVVEKISILSNEPRNFVTGLYAPAGEVIKIEISEQSLFNAGGKIQIDIGQVTHRSIKNNIPNDKTTFARYPKIVSTFTITEPVSYVGSFLGGPIYVYPNAQGNLIELTISGAVKYAHYIHGQTTREQVEEMRNYSAPYYDFEVWDKGVRHSGPAIFGNYNYDNLVRVGNLWENIYLTSSNAPSHSNTDIGVGFIYDTYVAVGSACAYRGGHTWVNAPHSWMEGVTNYDNMVTNGFWGHIHEFNHHFQNYGMGDITEVTNNANTLVSYALYTNISSYRTENIEGLAGWNKYTNPMKAMKETIDGAGGTEKTGLNTYANILQSFGSEVFYNAIKQQTRVGVSEWFDALCKATNYNMTYYFENMLNHSISEELKDKYANLPLYVPATCTYQTAIGHIISGEQVFNETVRPFEIDFSKAYILDFAKNILVPNDFTYEIKNLQNAKNGILLKQKNKVYKYIPNKDAFEDEFNLTITLNSQDFGTHDVTFKIKLNNKTSRDVVQTTYEYDTNYVNLNTAISNNFDNYLFKTNTTCTTLQTSLNSNEIIVKEGRIYIDKNGEYTLTIKGVDIKAKFMFGVNNKNLPNNIILNENNENYLTIENGATKLDLRVGDYIYFKQIVLACGDNATFDVGLTNISTNQIQAIPSSKLFCNEIYESKTNMVRVYNGNHIIYKSKLNTQRAISVNQPSWDDSYNIDNIFNGDVNSYYHNNKNNFVSTDNPFELIVDLGEEMFCNQMKISSRTSNMYNLPSTFDLYGGTDLNNLYLIKSYSNLELSGNTVCVSFDTAKIRYYKLVVTDTKSQNESANKYVTISQIDLSYIVSGTMQNATVLDYHKTTTGEFEKIDQLSTFGYVIKGNGEIDYSFAGTSIALISLQDNDCQIEVIVNGNSEIVNIKAQSEPNIFFEYSKDVMEKIDLKIKVISGKICLDSIICK